MGIVDVLFRPVFERSQQGGSRNAGERDDIASIKTYRYLRLGIIVVVVALFSSILFVRWTTKCWQGSISAYYYSPARPIFVSALIAIAVSLIVIKGSTLIEDLLLNIAGILAPIVAFVPTSFEPACLPGQPLGKGSGGLPDHIVRDAQNNVAALLIAAFVTLVLGVVVFAIEQHQNRQSTSDVTPRIVLLGANAVVLIAGSWLLATDRILKYHGWSAVALFVFLALASIANGIWLWRFNRHASQTTSPRWKVFSILYVALGVVMGVNGVIIKFLVPGPWDHRTLVLEMTEIALFAGIWAVQSIERWGKTLQRASLEPKGDVQHAGA